MNQLLRIPRSGSDITLSAMLDSPETTAPPTLACILLSPGVKPRVGPHRLYRKLSGEFVERGIPVLRLDFAGMGDSDGEYDTRVLSEVYARVQQGEHIADVRAAMDYLEAQHGIRRFVVGGLCGAAITGLLVAEQDPRVESLYSMGMPTVLVGAHGEARTDTPGVLASHREVLRRKALRPSRWLRFFTFQSDYKLLYSVVSESLSRFWRKLRPKPAAAAALSQPVPDYLDPNFIRAMFGVAESGRPALLLFGGGDRYLSEYRDLFEASFEARLPALSSTVDIEVVPEANHVLGSPEWIAAAREHTGAWLDRRVLKLARREVAASLRTEVITDEARLLALRTEWTAMLEASSNNSITLTWEWLTTWWKTYSTGRKLCIIAIWSGLQLIGAAPLLRRNVMDLDSSMVPVVRMELLASGEGPNDQICSDYIGWIAQRGSEEQVVNAVFDAVIDGRCGYWNEMVLPDMRLDSPMAQAILAEAERRKLECEVMDRATCPIIELPPDWNKYLAGLSSSHRYRVRRAMREFEEAGGVYEVADTPEKMRTMQAELIALHQTRWTGRGEPGAFGSELRRRFHEVFMPLALDRGWLRLGVLRLNGEAIGAIYNLRHGGRIFFYQSGILPQDSNGLKPGVLLHVHEIAAAIQAGCGEYDFLKRGESQYKDSWASGANELGTVRISRGGVVNGLVKLGRAARGPLAQAKNALLRRNSA